MDSAVLTLLTIGLPGTEPAGRKAADTGNDLLSPVQGNDNKEAPTRFQDVLASADLQSARGFGQQRPDAAGATNVSDADHLLEANFFKKLAQDSGKDVIAAVLPPTSFPLDQVPWQKSFVAAVAFDPALQPATPAAPVARDTALPTAQTVTPVPAVPDEKNALLSDDLPSSLTFSADKEVQTQPGTDGAPLEVSTISLVKTEKALQPDTTDKVPEATADPTAATLSVAVAVSPSSQLTADVAADQAQPNVSPPTVPNVAAVTLSTIPTAPIRTIAHTLQQNTGASSDDETEMADPLPRAAEGSAEAVKSSALKNSATSSFGSVLPSAFSSQIAAADSRNAFSPPSQGARETFATFVKTAFHSNEPSEDSSFSDALSPGALHPSSTYHLQAGDALPVKFSTAPKSPASSSPSEQISLHIVQAKSTKTDKITITLQPAELGKVEIRMHMDAGNHTTVNIQTESRETYHLLQADRGNLERILQDSGLKMDSSNLQFGYRGSQNESDSSGGQGFSGNGSDSEPRSVRSESSERDSITEPDGSVHIALSVTTGVNIRV